MMVTVEPRSRMVRRTARLAPPPVPDSPITLSAPPRIDSQPGGVVGWLQYLFPIVGSLGAMLFIVNNPKPLFLASGLLFMLGSVGMGAGMALQQRSATKRRTRGERTRYLDYLHNVRGELQRVAVAQRAASAWSHPPPDALLAITGSPARLWERRPEDSVFLELRVGDGRRPLAIALQVPPKDGPAAPHDPVCAAAMDELVRAQSWVEDDALTVDLKDSVVVTILGARASVLDAARALLSQLAVLHAPDDARLLLCASTSSASDWEWIKWLPHVRGPSGDGDAPAICDAAGLEAAISARAARAKRSAPAESPGSEPWLVVVADGVVPTPEVVISLRRTPSRTALVVLAESPAEEPGEVDMRNRVANGRLSIERPDAPGALVEGRADRLGPAAAEATARRLAPLRLSEEPGVRRLAETISLTELMGIGDVRMLDPAVTWRPRPLADNLRTPIGVSSQGEAVLVDLKGGAAFAGLQDLPHVAGLITNLADDLAMVDRMHAALFGEIRRRQELLRSAGNLASLREYQHRLTEGQALAPLPYLLVLVDEFGELLASRPDFIDLFVAVGRLGRSLGMHLLLSSQQLDEGRLRGLEGHLSYRIALRTFSAAESRTVLGVADTYELPPIPGSAYLKVGTTVYKRFRAALVSQVYSPPSDSDVGAPRPREFRLTNDASALRAVVQDPNVHVSGPTLLDVVVPHLRDAAAKAHQIWLPPLEPRVALDAILSPPPHPRSHGTLSVPIGLVDKPAEQKRDVLVADLSGAAGHLLVVGASLTGKTTLLRTLVASFALTHPPLEAQFYCIDYGGGGLSALAGLPHVGGVAGRQDPELVMRTVTSVSALVDEREAQFKAAGIDSLEA